MAQVPAAEPQEKKLWGAPLKVKQLEERITELEAEIFTLKGLQTQFIENPRLAVLEEENTDLKATLEAQNTVLKIAEPPQPYSLEVWNRHAPVDPDTGLGVPHRWHHFHADEEEWLYHDEQTLWADSGYGDFVLERLLAMAKAAYEGKGKVRIEERLGTMEKGNQTFNRLPAFDKNNKLVVILKVVKARTETV